MSAPGLLAFLGLPGAAAEGVPDRAQIDQAIRDVLARAEFQPKELTWWEQFTHWVGRLLERALGHVIGWIDLSSTLGKVIVVLLVVTLVAILVHLVWSLVHVGASAKRGAAGAAAGEGASTMLPVAGAVASELDAARAHAGRGDFAAAMHALYRATLFWLDERALVRFEPSKTAGDYRRELAQADSRRTFGSLLETFDPVAWGGRAAAPAAWERMRAAAAALGVPA